MLPCLKGTSQSLCGQSGQPKGARSPEGGLTALVSEEIFYVTTPIYYINDVPHIGHAYPTVAGDFITRFRRLQGRKVHYLTGTDEHGQKIARTAEANGAQPQGMGRSDRAPVDRGVGGPRHRQRRLHPHDRGASRGPGAEPSFRPSTTATRSISGATRALYCVGCEEFKTPDMLVDGKCPDHGIEPEVVKEDNYFFRLSKYADRLLELYEQHEPFVMPESSSERVARQGPPGSRRSFDVARQLRLGDPGSVGPEARHLRVGRCACRTTSPRSATAPTRNGSSEIWPADIHLIGKDILWFHAVIWPAMLMALELPLPQTVFASRSPAGRRREDVEDEAHRDLAARADRDVRFGRLPLLLHARGVSFGLDGNVLVGSAWCRATTPTSRTTSGTSHHASSR